MMWRVLKRVKKSRSPSQRFYSTISKTTTTTNTTTATGKAQGGSKSTIFKSKPLRKILLASTIGISLCYWYDQTNKAGAITRTIRAFSYITLIVADYKWTFNKHRLMQQQQQLTQQEIDAVHQRTADRLLYVFQKNGGMYIKMGQAIALQAPLLPPQIGAKLRVLYDQAPNISKEEVLLVIGRNFGGKRPEDVFEGFEWEPKASASIAQVHRGKIKTVSLLSENLKSDAAKGGEGEMMDVAIKIQKPAIKKQMEWDLFATRGCFWLVEKMFGIPMMWSVDYVERHVRKEVDFINEADNAEKCIRDVQELGEKKLRDNVYVPKVVRQLSTPEVMTAEWIDGIQMTQVINKHSSGNYDEELTTLIELEKEKWWDTREIMDIIMRLFSFQIFETGHVHGDPHPGNIIIRPHPKNPNKPQVVILDHGLYVQESARFKSQYAKFFKSIFTMDTKTMQDISKDWGITQGSGGEDTMSIFTSLTIMRPSNSMFTKERSTTTVAVEGGANNSPGEVMTMPSTQEIDIQMKMKNYAINLLEEPGKFPPELVFITRNINIVRSLNKMMGSPVNRLVIMAKSAARNSSFATPSETATAATTSVGGRGFDRALIMMWNELKFNITIYSLNLKFYWYRVCNTVEYLVDMLKLYLFGIKSTTTTGNTLDRKYHHHVSLRNYNLHNFRNNDNNNSSSKGRNFESSIDQALAKSIESQLGYKIDLSAFDA